MADHDLMLGQDHNIAIGQKQPSVLGLNHNIGVGHTHDLDLRQARENNLGIRKAHEHELGLLHANDNEWSLDQHHNQDGNDGNENEIALERKPDRDDHELALDAPNHELTLTAQNHELALYDKYELGVSENHELGENLELVDENNQMAVESAHDIHSEFMTMTPVLQECTLAGNPCYELTVGQEFSDVKSCRRALRDTTIALQ